MRYLTGEIGLMTGNYKYFTNENGPSLEEVLANREKRVSKIRFLDKKYPKDPVLCFKLNIPGKEKTNVSVLRIFEIGIEDIKSALDKNDILFEKKEDLITGPEFYLVISIDPLNLKRKMTDLEENSYFGRLFDIDILYEGQNIDRQMIGEGPRKCFLCDNDAKVCARSRKHSLDEMIRWIEKMIDEYEGLNEK